MADKSKMSVAEILAAARKADGGDDSGDSSPPADNQPAAEPAESSSVEKEVSDPPASTPKSGSGRPSVAEMLAMARGEKQAAESPSPAKEKPAPKPAAQKTAPKKKAAVATEQPPLDTQSIMAAARKSQADRPGPITKAEAIAQGKPVAPKVKKPKEQIVVPPMPVKPEYAKVKSERTKEQVAERRSFLFGLTALATGFTALAVTSFLFVMGTVRFMFPNILREPPSRFKVGFPDQFPAGQVQTKFKAQFGVWVVNTDYQGEQQIFALKSVCTHLGCTPNWLEAEQKFKCPCHGSGFYKDGVNFEGPAPRPLERYAIAVADDGQIEIDKSAVFQEEMGQWADGQSFVSV